MGLALDEPNNNELPIQVNGLDVLISDKVKGFADGSLIDYINSPVGEGFTISNDNSITLSDSGHSRFYSVFSVDKLKLCHFNSVRYLAMQDTLR